MKKIMVHLTAKTRRGQNKIDQHGDTWNVRKTEVSWLSPNTLLIESQLKTFKAHMGTGVAQEWQTDWRWVSLTADKDFHVRMVA
jgi:hypothetical protein